MSDDKYHQMIDDIINEREGGLEILLSMVETSISKIVNKRARLVCEYLGSTSDVITDLQHDFIVQMTKKDFAALRKLDKNTLHDFERYANKTALNLLRKMLTKEYKGRAREVLVEEHREAANEESSRNNQRLMGVLEDTMGKVIKGQQLKVMSALFLNVTKGGDLNQNELAAQMGMTTSQFNKYKHEAVKRLKEFYGSRTVDELEEVAARLQPSPKLEDETIEKPTSSRL